MREKNKFVLVFLLTIFIIRLILYFIPRNAVVYTDKIHHIFFGIILLIVYLFARKQAWSRHLLAITLGLIADQITQAPFYIADLFYYELMPISFWSYWSSYSVISTLIAVIISIILIYKYKKWKKTQKK